MNAPATPAAVIAAAKLEFIPIGKLKPSTTHIQELRRARFDKKSLAELADSIRKVGILQPIVARPLADGFEIVAGERRFLAAKLAGLASVPANVSELTDDLVLEIQLIENLQREGLHELEEAEGYGELMKLKKINADAVADLVGMSRSYVYARTKLLALCPEARKAFYAGELDSSRALLVARIPNHEIQAKALVDVLTKGEEVRNEKDRWVQGPMTYREAQEHIRQTYTADLKKAIFDIKSATLLPKAGTCDACPKRSGNQKELHAEIRNADVCTDPKCFDEKRQAHFAVARTALEAKGKKVVYGDAAKRLLPRWEDGDDDVTGGYKRLNDTVYVGHVSRKVADVLGKDFEPTLLQHPHSGKILEVATEQAIAKASSAAGKGGKSQPSSGSSGAYNYRAAQARAAAKGPDVDEMLTVRLAKLIHEKAPKDFGKAWLLDLARQQLDMLNTRGDSLEAVALAWGWSPTTFDRARRLPAEVSKLDSRDLVLLMFHLIFACGPYTRDSVLKLFGISEQKTRELIIEERKKAAAAARAKGKAEREAKKPKSRPVDKVNAAIDKRALKHTPAWPFATKSKLTAAKKKPAAKKSKSKPTTKGKKK